MVPFLILLVLFGVPAGCDARISITGSTSWTASRSLDQQVVVENGVTLTIRSDDPAKPLFLQLSDKENVGGGFKVRPQGSLVLENVILTRISDFDHEIIAISFVDNTGGFVSLNNVRCQHMSMCIQRFCCDGNQVVIEDSTFYNNTIALAGDAQLETVKTSLFVDNRLALSGASWIVEDCFFLRNDKASTAEDAKFVRTIFVENDKAVEDPRGTPSPFLEDCLFYRNRRSVLPSNTNHASISTVSFIENQIGIYCSTQMSTLSKVNFMNNTQWNLVYAGISDSNVGDDVYWGSFDKESIADMIFDANRGSQGGSIQFSSFANEPFLHDLVVTVLKRRPTSLLKGIEKYFQNWSSKIEQLIITTETKFDFNKLKEWADDEPTDLTDVDNGDITIDVDPGGDPEATVAPSEEIKGSTQQATIQLQDQNNAILFISVAINICFVWIISVVAYEYCCRPRWAASVDAKSQRDKEEKVQLMERDGWIHYEEDPMPRFEDGVPRNRSSPFRGEDCVSEHAKTNSSGAAVQASPARKSRGSTTNHTIKII